MAVEIGKIRQVTYETYADGTEKPLRLNRRSEGIVLSPLIQASLDKKVFMAHIGLASTPVSFAKTAYDADQPQLVVDVPDGKTIVPLEILLVLEDSAGTDNEVIALASGTNVGAGTSTAVTPTNHFVPSSGSAPVSACSVYSLYTANGTDPNTAPYFEFWRETDAFAATVGEKTWKWSALESPPPVIQGTGSLVIYVSATTTAPAGYLRVKWWELASDDV